MALSIIYEKLVELYHNCRTGSHSLLEIRVVRMDSLKVNRSWPT